MSTEDIFADLGFREEMQVRSDLLSEVVALIRGTGLSQKIVADILRISAPKVSSLMTGKINDFSNDTLMHYLTLLGCNIEITIVIPGSRGGAIKKGVMQVKKTAARRRRSKTLK